MAATSSVLEADEPETVIAHARYEWDCPCGEVVVEDHDPAGEQVECPACGETFRVEETR